MRANGRKRLAMDRIAVLAALAAVACGDQHHSRGATFTVGDLTATFADNGDSPHWLSGARSVVHGPTGASAFDTVKRWSGGLNFEHLIAGHFDPANAFEPRRGWMGLSILPTGDGVVLYRPRETSQWAVESSIAYRMLAPNHIDMDFRCTVHDPARFAPESYAAFFFASYMHGAESPAITFPSDGGLVSVVEPGTYIGRDAEHLEIAPGHDSPHNLAAHDAPRIDEPYYFGRFANGMVWVAMFDKLVAESDEIRFALFAFKGSQLPAWDFSYVLRDLAAPCGFRARFVFEPFGGADDVADEFAAWSEELGEP
jgi:hypothetical protein